jgi:hypothetical protein
MDPGVEAGVEEISEATGVATEDTVVVVQVAPQVAG